jgi:2-iminobutanoate/2-iminopropanoate deaminase
LLRGIYHSNGIAYNFKTITIPWRKEMCECCKKTIVKTDKAPKAIGPYSAGVIGGRLIFTAGQLGLSPETGIVVEGGVEAETHQAIRNLKGILEEAGSGLEFVVKTTVFLRDMNDFARVNTIYGEYFSENAPARSAVQVAALPKGLAVEIEAVAVVPCKDENCDCK